jgi:hypothetical protein
MKRLKNNLAFSLSMCLMVLAVQNVAVSGQGAKPAAAGPERYAGTWKGEYKGQTFAILKLKMDGQKLVGTIGFSQITIDKDGEMQKVSGEVSDQTAIYDLKPNGDVLLFKHKDDDDVDELELKLKNDKEAELRFVNAAAGSDALKAPKPLQLKKEAEKR